MSKTVSEIEKLKKEWVKNPCWDIEDTEGFEEYKQELLEYGEEQTLASFFFEDVKRKYFFEHPVISGVVPVDNQELIDKLNSMELKEGQMVDENPPVYVKTIQDDDSIILSGLTKYNS